MGFVLLASYQNDVTQREFESLSPRSQDVLRRYTAQRAQSGVWSGQPYPPQYTPNRFKRYGKRLPTVTPENLLRSLRRDIVLRQSVVCMISDWLLDKQYFDSMGREDRYAVQRLGFAAPNIFIVTFSGY